MSLFDDHPLVSRSLRPILPVDIPDSVPAVLKQGVRLKETVPCRGAPVLLSTGGYALAVAEVPQFVQGGAFRCPF